MRKLLLSLVASLVVVVFVKPALALPSTATELEKAQPSQVVDVRHRYWRGHSYYSYGYGYRPYYRPYPYYYRPYAYYGYPYYYYGRPGISFGFTF